ncbi:MAG TPA: hypothetical protein VFQ35_16995 [Polyangiaceae bacterium]|nr:hypothetical protein [Polyangiaceae bacterium]
MNARLRVVCAWHWAVVEQGVFQRPAKSPRNGLRRSFDSLDCHIVDEHRWVRRAQLEVQRSDAEAMSTLAP